MAVYNTKDIESWERFYRANFINSLTGFKSASLIGTVDGAGNANLGIFSNIVHIGADPALVGYINRPVAAAPHTLSNIEATGFFTINHIAIGMELQAHQTSAKYAQGVSEFWEVGLTAEYCAPFAAPFVKESRVKYGLELQDIVPIKLNGTALVIGKIISIMIDEAFVLEDGFVQLDKADTICSNGTDAYYTTELLGRYSYAKPGVATQKIN